jgi:hypothetical protein
MLESMLEPNRVNAGGTTMDRRSPNRRSPDRRSPDRTDSPSPAQGILRWLQADAGSDNRSNPLAGYLDLSGGGSTALLPLAAPRPSRRDLILVVSWLVIGLVAAYDTYLSVKFQDTLQHLEINPLCRWLIAADEGSVAILLGCKFAGTVLALGTILLVYLCNRSVGVAVASVVALLQGLVLMYLCLA